MKWQKVTDRAWSVELTEVEGFMTITRGDSGVWRLAHFPSSGSVAKTLDCADDLEAAQRAALRYVAEQARERIQGDTVIMDAALAALESSL